MAVINVHGEHYGTQIDRENPLPQPQPVFLVLVPAGPPQPLDNEVAEGAVQAGANDEAHGANLVEQELALGGREAQHEQEEVLQHVERVRGLQQAAKPSPQPAPVVVVVDPGQVESRSGVDGDPHLPDIGLRLEDADGRRDRGGKVPDAAVRGGGALEVEEVGVEDAEDEGRQGEADGEDGEVAEGHLEDRSVEDGTLLRGFAVALTVPWAAVGVGGGEEGLILGGRRAEAGEGGKLLGAAVVGKNCGRKWRENAKLVKLRERGFYY